MEGHAQQCVERYCELAHKKVEQVYKSFKSLPGMIINSSRRNSNQLENCQKYSHELSSKTLYLARIVRPEILWSVNKLARAVTKWTQACDRRVARLISYIHHTNEFRQCCHVGQHGSALLTGVYFKTHTLLATLRTQSQPLGCLVYFWK